MSATRVGVVPVDDVCEVHRAPFDGYRRSSEMMPAVRISKSRSANVSVVAGRMPST